MVTIVGAWSVKVFQLTPLDAVLLFGPLAQLVEQQTLNLRVEGSIPSRFNKFFVFFFFLVFFV